MDIQQLVRDSGISLSGRQVYGEPIERDGAVIIPAAAVRGGGGGGTGHEGPEESGTGGGFGLTARPVGAFVIQDGKVRWMPVIDVSRLLLGGQIVAGLFMLALRVLWKGEGRALRRRRFALR